MRWIFRLLVILVVLVVGAVFVISFIPAERIAGFATQEISARTGRDVSFSGKIKPVFFPILGVKTGAFSIGNADWSDEPEMLTAQSLLVGVELMPLLSGRVKLKEFRLEGVDIRLEKAQDGRANWELDQTDAAITETTASSSGLPEFSLKIGRVTNGRITFIDRQAGTETSVNGIDLTLRMPDFAGEAILSGAVSYNDQKVTFDGKLSGLGPLLTGALTDVDLNIGGGFGAIKFMGQAGLSPLVAAGALNVSVNDMNVVGLLAGIGDFAAGKLKTASVETKLTYSEDGSLFFRDAEVLIDKNRLTADIDITQGERLFVTAKLVGGDLDFSSLTGGGDASGASETTGWSTDPIDLAVLHLLDADIGFAAASVNLGMARLGETRLRAKLDQGRLAIDLTKVVTYGGAVSGEYVINARSGSSMGGNLAGSAIQLQPLLTDLADYDRLIAGAWGKVKFLTSGNSIDAMMNNLSGSGRMDIGAGELIGLDLAGMLRNLDASFRGSDNKTIFSEISGSFAITDGVLANDDLVFSSGHLDATGAGQVDIGAQSMNYRVVPVAFSGESVASGAGISVPVLIDGPWSNLNFRPDLQSLFDAELDKQKADIEARTKANIEKTKEEAKQRLKEEADKALKKIAEDALKKALGLD
ncbi:MAG: AsmA protein [Paracoccaceae bacterium]|jgi:AsmA protein